MNRTSTLVSILFCSAALAVACDKAADDQQKANNAQAEANKQIISARVEADKRMEGAQAEADKKIAAAQADFLKLREDYRHKTTVALTDLDKNIEEAQIKGNKATGATKADLENKLRQIRASRESFAAEMKTLDAASASTWDGTKARLDKDWVDLKTLVDKT